MSLAFDAVSSKYESSEVASSTLSHTCASGDGILVVIVYCYDGDRVTGITYNGVAMTETGTTLSSGSDRINRWYLLNPATGANNIVVSLSPNARVAYGAISLLGAKQSGQPDATDSDTGSGTTATGSITTVADNAWGIMSAFNAAGGTYSSGSNCTIPSGGTIADRFSIGYGGPKTPAGAFSQAIGMSQNNSWITAQLSISPATAFTITAAQGSFTLTGQDSLFKKGYAMVAALGEFVLTGLNAVLPGEWKAGRKSSSTWTNTDKS